MNTEFEPVSSTTKISMAAIFFVSFVLLAIPATMGLGIVLLLLPLGYCVSLLRGYKKYIVTDTCMQVVNWSGTIKSEVEFKDITNMYLHQAYGQGGRILPVNIEVDTLVIDLTGGYTAKFDVSAIDNSDELATLIKSKWNDCKK
jgi:hypothetical protein